MERLAHYRWWGIAFILTMLIPLLVLTHQAQENRAEREALVADLRHTAQAVQSWDDEEGNSLSSLYPKVHERNALMGASATTTGTEIKLTDWARLSDSFAVEASPGTTIIIHLGTNPGTQYFCLSGWSEEQASGTGHLNERTYLDSYDGRIGNMEQLEDAYEMMQISGACSDVVETYQSQQRAAAHDIN